MSQKQITQQQQQLQLKLKLKQQKQRQKTAMFKKEFQELLEKVKADKDRSKVKENVILDLLFRLYMKNQLDIVPKVVVQYIKKNGNTNMFTGKTTYSQ